MKMEKIQLNYTTNPGIGAQSVFYTWGIPVGSEGDKLICYIVGTDNQNVVHRQEDCRTWQPDQAHLGQFRYVKINGFDTAMPDRIKMRGVILDGTPPELKYNKNVDGGYYQSIFGGTITADEMIKGVFENTYKI